MKYILLFLSLFLAFSYNCNSQTRKHKSTLTYLLTKTKTVLDSSGNELNIVTKKGEIRIEIDTQIVLNTNKKLVVFNKCFNDILFSKNIPIINDSVHTTEQRADLIGTVIKDKENSISDNQITVFYQIDNVVYNLTMPNFFLERKFKDKNFINNLRIKLDALISKDSLFGIYDSYGYIFLEGVSISCKHLFILKGGNEDKKLITGKNDYLFNFYRYKGNRKIKNQISPNCDLYTKQKPLPFYTIADIYFSSKINIIVRSVHSFYDKENECKYTLKLDLKKIK